MMHNMIHCLVPHQPHNKCIEPPSLMKVPYYRSRPVTSGLYLTVAARCSIHLSCFFLGNVTFYSSKSCKLVTSATLQAIANCRNTAFPQRPRYAAQHHYFGGHLGRRKIITGLMPIGSYRDYAICNRWWGWRLSDVDPVYRSKRICA